MFLPELLGVEGKYDGQFMSLCVCAPVITSDEDADFHEERYECHVHTVPIRPTIRKSNCCIVVRNCYAVGWIVNYLIITMVIAAKSITLLRYMRGWGVRDGA